MKIEYSDDRVSAEIEVRQTTVLDDFKRTRMMYEIPEGAELKDVDALILRRTVYPSVVCCTSGTLTIEGRAVTWPPTFEQFLSLPAALEVKIEMAAYKLNPHWTDSSESAEEQEKKAIAPSGASSTTSTTNPTKPSRKKASASTT
jgi:hypothetical protein